MIEWAWVIWAPSLPWAIRWIQRFKTVCVGCPAIYLFAPLAWSLAKFFWPKLVIYIFFTRDDSEIYLPVEKIFQIICPLISGGFSGSLSDFCRIRPASMTIPIFHALERVSVNHRTFAILNGYFLVVKQVEDKKGKRKNPLIFSVGGFAAPLKL